jgi:hypothetical protein
VIQLNDEQYWLYAAVDPKTNKLLHTKLKPTVMKVFADSFLAELSENTTLTTLCFSSLAPNRYKLRVTDTASISDTKTWKSECCRTYL